MNITFDTQHLTPDEALGLIALLETLRGYGSPVSNSNPTPTTEEQAIFGTPIPAEPSRLAIVGAGMKSTEEVPTPSATEPTTRKRRTKAEIAADEAAKQTPAEPASAAAPAEVPSTPSKIDADTLRSLLNAHIAKHSLEEAIAILQAFGCNRVTEALALDPAKLAELAGRLQE